MNQLVLLQVERGRSNDQVLPAAKTKKENFEKKIIYTTLKCEIKTAAW